MDAPPPSRFCALYPRTVFEAGDLIFATAVFYSFVNCKVLRKIARVCDL